MSLAQSIDHSLSNELTPHQLAILKKTIEYEQAALSPNTRRTYASMWRKFDGWCTAHNLQPLPASAETIALYLGDLGGEVSFATLDSTIAAIEKEHAQKGLTISGNQSLYRRVRKGIRRTHKEKQSIRKAKAITPSDLLITCQQMGSSLKEARDKAIILLAFFGALRRSEAIGLDFENIEFTEKGMTLTLMQTKTSDTAEQVYLGYTKDPVICPINALKEWLAVSSITEGPIFRSLLKGGQIAQKRLSGHAVADIMKKAFGEEYSGHSARRGLCTANAAAGTSIVRMKQHSRHKGTDILTGYIEAAESASNTTSHTLGL